MDYPAPLPVTRLATAPKPCRVHAVAMVRNDADIILPFLRQCAALFDTTYIIDIQSTDGTRECIAEFDAGRGRIVCLSTNRQEKFQGPMMNTLSRHAFANGADWVFLLDADELIDISSRAALESYLADFNADVMHLSWVNLVPSTYGGFSTFEPDQEFRRSGRASTYFKVALSNLFAANHPDYYIHEGNHHVSPRRGAPELPPCFGLPLLHVPIRSVPRFKYKISGALRVTKAKHNRAAGEGSHVEELDRLLASNITRGELNHFAGHYGDKTERKQELAPAELDWPIKRLPPFVSAGFDEPPSTAPVADLSQTLLRDQALTWDKSTFAAGSPVAALLEHDAIRIAPQTLRGDGQVRHGRFARLGEKPADPRNEMAMLTDAAGIACMRIKRYAFSAWSELIPVLFALLSVSRPRRFVELGVHNGMSFFAACQAVEHLKIDAECVAIDSWVGDEHAGFHSDEVFTNFKAYAAANHPNQFYVQSYFDAALQCFEDGSIDLLHIDGLHTYDAVRSDFETWLPKMSNAGVIMFHDTNVLEREFGVWRLWDELRQRYPGFNFLHKHGLGIIYVGSASSPVASVLRDLATNSERAVLAQTFFEAAGTLVIEHRSRLEDCDRLRNDTEILHRQIHQIHADHAVRTHEVAAQLAANQRDIELLRTWLADAQNLASLEAERLRAIYSSSAWRITGPFRRMLSRAPLLRRFVRGTARVAKSIVRPSRNRSL